MMNFKNNRFNLILIILFVIYAIIMFLLFKIDELFIISFVITIIAFIIQFIMVYYLDGRFNNFPLFIITGLYLFIQMILSFCLVLFRVSFNISVIIQCVILGIFIIFELLLSQAKDHIENVEVNTKIKTEFLTSVRKDVEILYKNSDEKFKEDLFDLLELVKFSNPVSSEESFKLESEIVILINELKVNLNQNNEDEFIRLLDLLKNNFNEREVILRK